MRQSQVKAEKTGVSLKIGYAPVTQGGIDLQQSASKVHPDARGISESKTGFAARIQLAAVIISANLQVRGKKPAVFSGAKPDAVNRHVVAMVAAFMKSSVESSLQVDSTRRLAGNNTERCSGFKVIEAEYGLPETSFNPDC